MKDDTSLKYFLTDHLGSVLSVLDSGGTVLSTQRYMPFGQVRENIGSITQTDFAFTGQRNLGSELGLMDYRARMYSSSLGRFIQPDSIVPSAANPQAFNRYSYVLNNPLKYIDPSGHKPCWATARYSCNLSQAQLGALRNSTKPSEKGFADNYMKERGIKLESSYAGHCSAIYCSGIPYYATSKSAQGTQAWYRYAATKDAPFNTLFIEPTAFLRLPIGVSINAGLAIDLRPINAFVNYLKGVGSPESIGQLPRQFARMITNLNIGVYGKGTFTAGLEVAGSVGVTGGVTTTTMDDLAGISTISDELTVHGEVCLELCVGATGSDNSATPNEVDSAGIYLGYGAGGGIGVDLVAATDWIIWGSLGGKGCAQVPFTGISTGGCP